MNRNVKIAKELLKIAKTLMASDDKTYEITNDKLIITIPSDGWRQFGKKPEWVEIVGCLDESCKGRFFGIDHSCSKPFANGFEIVTLEYDGRNDADHKSPKKEIENNLKALGFSKK